MRSKANFIITSCFAFVAATIIHGCKPTVENRPPSQPAPQSLKDLVEGIGDGIGAETWMSKGNQIGKFLKLGFETQSISKIESGEVVIKIQNRSEELYFDIEKVALSIKRHTPGEGKGKNKGKDKGFEVKTVEINILEKVGPGITYTHSFTFEKGDEVLSVTPIAQHITVSSK